MARFLKFMRRLNRVSNRKRKFPRLKRLLALLGIFLLLLLPYGLLNPRPVQAQAQGSVGGFMELTSVFFGEGSRTFGPGQVITISGSIPFIPVCPSMKVAGVKGRGEGIFDFFPVADFYVIKDDGQPLKPLDPLVDVNGPPNRITGGPQGVFVEEVVGITKPAGNLGPGRYKIVMNQCLTGVFDPVTDIVLGDPPNLGFEVVAAGTLPIINYHLLKDRASDYAEELSGTKLSALGVSVTIPGFCSLYGKLLGKSSLSVLFSFGKIALDRCSDLIATQKGIAADPPDPNYTQFAELGPLAYDFTDIPSTPLERATRDLAHNLTDQAAISKALLTSIERFQGAQAASNDEFTILQMQAASKYIDLLIGPGGAVLRFYANLEALDFALQQDPLGSLPEAADLHAFIPEMRQGIGGLLRPLGTALNDLRINGTDTFTPVGLQEWIAVYVGTDPFLPSLGLPGIPQIRAQNGLPPISFHHPISNPGGAYNVPPGRMITFDASKSSDPDGDALTFAWDLTGSGAFSDATGAVVQFSYAQPGTRLVGVKATDPTGNTNVSYALVKIGDVNAQDIIATPASRELFRVAPDGSFTTLNPAGVGFNDVSLRALHVDLNRDIWVLDTTSFKHYDSTGALLNTISINQVGILVGVPLLAFNDFTLDGRGDILVIARTGNSTLWTWKLLRLAKDASSASFIADVSRGPTQPCSGDDSPSLAIDNAGNVVVGMVSGPSPQFPFTQSGVWTVDPTNGSMQQVIPSDAGANCGLIPSPFGPFQQLHPFFGPNDFHARLSVGRESDGEGIKVDSRGDYIAAGINQGLYRIFIPPELSLSGINLALQVFPIQLSSSLLFNDFAINSSGDYLEGGYDAAGVLGEGIFRVSPDSSVFKLSSVHGPLGPPHKLDVVPGVRQVTPKDLPPDPTVHLNAISISQYSCPGAATLNATVSNTGSGPLKTPVRVLWLDGDPEGAGTVIGSALVPVPLAPGVPVDLSASWPNPTLGTHQVFVMAMGANTVSAAFLVCVPTSLVSNPAATLTVTAGNAQRAYGDANPTFTGTITGIVSGDNITATYASTAMPGSPVGTYAVVPTLVDQGNKLGNYTVTSNNGTLTVSPAALTVTAANATRAYGASNPAFTGTITGIVNGDNITATYATVATPASPVGTYWVVPTLVDPGSKLGNYAVFSNNGTLTVNPAALTVTGANASRMYGAANPAFTGTISGILNGDNIAATYASTATPGSPVGTYAVVPTLVDLGNKLGNYTVLSNNGGLSVTPAPLTITAYNASRFYGSNNPALTGTILGIQNLDPISATYVPFATTTSAVGIYPIVPSAVGPANVLSNYTLSLVNGMLTIVPETTTLTVTLSPPSIIVGQSTTATVTLTALDMVIPIDPSVLAPLTVSSPIVSDILTNNGTCTLVPGAAPGIATCSVTLTAVEPNGRTLNASFPGTANLAASTRTASLIVTAPLESKVSCIKSDFRNAAVPGGSYLWFNSIFKIEDAKKQKVTITFFQSSIQFQYLNSSNSLVNVNQAVPDARIIFDPSVTTASTTFDAINNVWLTTVPFDLDDRVFLTGIPWLVPAGGIPGDIEPVTWCGTFASDTAGVEMGWRWAAAAYSSFSADGSVLGNKPMDSDHDNPASNHDRAGTPENFKSLVIPGARGRGGKNYTGTYSGSAEIE